MNTKTRTWIKHLALALCLAMPFVSRAAAVGDTITWTNAGDLTADDVVNANHCSFEFSIPGDENLPTGSVVRITKVEIASINATRTSNSSTTDKLNDPHFVSFGNVKSAECDFITTETLAGKYIDSYTFEDECNVTIGKNYPEYTAGGHYSNMSGYGVTCLHSNGNRWSGGTRMDCTVGGTTSGFIKNGNIYPIYRITAEVVSIHKDVEVSSDTTASAINGMVGTATDVAVAVADGVTITIDTAFATEIKSVSSTGTITLSAETQPDLSGIAFNVQGALLRSWLAPGVVGVNFVKNYGNVVSGELVTSDSWVETTGANGNATTLFTDGLTKVTWSSGGTYSYSGSDNEGSSFIHGYLDDGDNKGNGVEIYIDNVPYETYDVVIYASTDTSNARFQPKTVNGTSYTVDSLGVVSAGNAVWGQSRLETPVYGQNAMRIKNLSGSLAIYGGLNTYSTNKGRGGIAAIQIMPPTAEDNITEYTLELDGVATDWTTGAWKIGTDTAAAPLTGYAKITLTASTTLTIDDTVALTRLIVNGAEDAVLTLVAGSGTLVVNGSVVVEGGILQQGSESVLGATLSVVVNEGATFDMNGLGINASTKVYLAGAGAGNWPWALTSSYGAGGAILGGLYLTGNATIGGANELKVGQTQNGYHCYLQGYTLTKIGAGAFTGTNMNTPGTGTIDVQGGAMSVNQWNNLNNGGGNTTVILHTGASLANGTDRVVPMGTLKLLGGTLTTTRAFKANTLFVGAGETANLAFGAGASASLTGDLTVTGALTLDGAMAFNKDENAANDVVVTASGTMSSSGAISVGAGVTLNIGTSRPTGEITVAEGGTLAAQLQNVSDVIELSVSAQPGNVILYDASGDVVSNPRISYADGTLTIMPPVPTLEASGEVAFDTASNWINSTMPDVNGDAIIELSDDATISVSGTYALGSLTITGVGEATFAGEGSITAGNVSVKNGATFVRNATISATTGISLDSGTVLKLNGVTESAAISGAGAVETYGAVVLNHANTMTGGITVKPGSLLSASAAGAYGEYQDSWAYTQQRQVIVENGGTVDINNIANNDGGVALTIAGKGVVGANGVYAGAVKYSGANAITSGSRQISSLVLTGDAMVDVGAGWGLVHSGWKNARLGLNGHMLTVRGTGTFPVVNANNLSGTSTTGTLVMDGATLELSNAASNLTGVNVVAKSCSTLNLAAAPSALGSLTIAPTTNGTTATAWNLPEGLVTTVNTINVDPAALSVGDSFDLLTVPSAVELTGDTVSVRTGGRYEVVVSGNKVTATVNELVSFFHYDFNEANSIAADSKYNFGSLNPAFVSSKNGKAGVFDSSYKPYYGSNTSGKSPFYAGEMSVTALLKVKEASNTIIWNFGSGWDTGIALIAKDSTTIALVSWTGGAAGSDVVSVTGVSDLMNKWHLVTIVANASGTTLYVDDKSASVDTVLPSGISGQGQFGSIHGTAKNYNAVSEKGFLLDDWRVYDFVLTDKEIRNMHKALLPDPFVLHLR